MPLKPGDNPRAVLSRHNERGPKRFVVEYSYEDLSRMLGISEGAVRLAVHRGRFDPSKFEEVVGFAISKSQQLNERKSLKALVAEARNLSGLEE